MRARTEEQRACAFGVAEERTPEHRAAAVKVSGVHVGARVDVAAQHLHRVLVLQGARAGRAGRRQKRGSVQRRKALLVARATRGALVTSSGRTSHASSSSCPRAAAVREATPESLRRRCVSAGSTSASALPPNAVLRASCTPPNGAASTRVTSTPCGAVGSIAAGQARRLCRRKERQARRGERTRSLTKAGATRTVFDVARRFVASSPQRPIPQLDVLARRLPRSGDAGNSLVKIVIPRSQVTAARHTPPSRVAAACWAWLCASALRARAQARPPRARAAAGALQWKRTPPSRPLRALRVAR